MCAVRNALGHVRTFHVAHQGLWITDNLGIAADDVQGRADFVTHVLQEIHLHALRFVTLVAGNEQFAVLLLQSAHIAQAVHAINQETNEQRNGYDNVKGPLIHSLQFVSSFALFLCMLQVGGRTYHLLAHDDVVHRVLDGHVAFLALEGTDSVTCQFVDFRLEFKYIGCVG